MTYIWEEALWHGNLVGRQEGRKDKLALRDDVYKGWLVIIGDYWNGKSVTKWVAHVEVKPGGSRDD